MLGYFGIVIPTKYHSSEVVVRINVALLSSTSEKALWINVAELTCWRVCSLRSSYLAKMDMEGEKSELKSDTLWQRLTEL